MAEGKKSFVLYSDQEAVFSELTDEQAGKLIKHIYSYVNDEDPVLEDQLLKVCFAPIKLQLKRDLEKWNQKQIQRSEAGKRSAEIRKQNLTTVNDREQTPTVNVNVNGNVNDNVTVNDINSIYTAEKSKILFYENGLSGNFMKKMCQIHSINFDVAESELTKWIISNDTQNFETKRHLENSFNNWLRNYKPPKKTTTKSTFEQIDKSEFNLEDT